MNEIITIENGKSTMVTGATKVVSCTPTQAVVQTSTDVIIFAGNEIEVKKLDIENAVVTLLGNLTSVKFTKKAEKQPLFRRIFK